MPEPQQSSADTYRELVERIVSSKVAGAFDPSSWRTDLFGSDEELEEFLDDIYATRRRTPAA